MSATWQAWNDWVGGKRGFVLAPGVYDALSAKVAAHIGFDALYMTGFGTAASLGLPDVGLATLTEMAANVGRIVEASGLPLIADADTGYGNPINVGRTVRSYERAGAAGLHIEDQVFPKKCGFFEGKQVIPAEEHVQKVKAACDARNDDHFVIIARTDALAVNGWDDVVERVGLYREAGADLVFVDGIRSTDDLDAYVQKVVKAGLPALYNGALVPAARAEALGFRVQICGGSHGIAYYAMRSALLGVKQNGNPPSGPLIEATAWLEDEVPAITDVLGLPDIYTLERQYGRYGPDA
jgi:2-methylisocitrate lyase-like PEP mutase family enzyme